MTKEKTSNTVELNDRDLDAVHGGGKLGLDSQVVSPRDAASGLPTGKRQHKPFNLSTDTTADATDTTADADGNPTEFNLGGDFAP